MNTRSRALSLCEQTLSARDALADALRTAIRLARAGGADQSEAHTHVASALGVTARNGEVDTVEHSEERGLTITVFKSRQRGSAQTNDLTAAGIQRTVDAALDIARHAEQDAASGLAEPERLATEARDLDLFHPWLDDVTRMTALAERMDRAARAVDPRITQTDRSAVTTTAALTGYANSHDFFAITPSTRHALSAVAIAESGGAKERDHWHDVRRVPEALLAPEAVGQRAGERTARRLDARQAPTGKVPVVFEAPVAGSLVGHLIGAISGSALYRKASFLLDAVGQQVLPERIQLTEEPLEPRGYASSWFDSEGVAPTGGAIVENGVLARYVLSSYSARRLKLVTTGNAGGTRNLTLSHDDAALTDLLAEMDRGVLITELLGFGVNLVNGDYSRGASGFWVEDGEIRYPINEFTVAGNLKDMFRAVRLVGNDIDDRGNTRCGSILIGGMTIAGA